MPQRPLHAAPPSVAGTRITPAHTALLVIDMVNDFIDPQGEARGPARTQPSTTLAP